MGEGVNEMEFQEFTGKTVDEAVEKGLKELGISKQEAEIVILEEGKKKLFGSIKARVQIAKKESAEKACVAEQACVAEESANEAPMYEVK